MWFEPLIILGIGALISLGLYAYYLPQIRYMKERYEKFSSTVREKLIDMTEDERREFFSNMPKETQNFFKGILYDDFAFQGIDQFHTSQLHLQQVEQINQEQFRQFTQWAMDEGLKSVTPFDHGGYVQGPGFNPSDTMAYESMQMHNHMDHMHSNMDNMNTGMDHMSLGMDSFHHGF